MFEIDLHRLSVFYTVVNEGTLSKAGERLFMSQPAISAHIKALEEQLGMPLFYRVGRRSIVNRAGEVLYKKTAELLSAAEELWVEMENLKGISNGRLALAASLDWQYRLPRALEAYKQVFPGVELSMEVANSERVEKLVSDRSVDFGFTAKAPSRSGLESERLGSEPLLLVCNVNHHLARVGVVAPSALREEALIVRESGSAARHAANQVLAEHDLTRNISMELGSYEAIKGAVMAGKEIGIVSETSVGAELQAGLLAAIDAPWLASRLELHMVYSCQKKMTATEKAFLEMVASGSVLADLASATGRRAGRLAAVTNRPQQAVAP